MGMKLGMSVGVRFDGTIDVDIESDGEWNLSVLELDEAEFLVAELQRAIARQKERGFPKPEPEPEPADMPEPTT